MRESDVVIIGAGPSGIATAANLARVGVDVTLLDRDDFAGRRVGEHLSPEGRALLATGQTALRIDETGHQKCFGIQAVWGDEAPRHMDYLFHPFGHGLNLSRPRFDAELAACAQRVGVHLFTGIHVRLVRDSPGWVVEGGGTEFRARFLVDATGRSAAFARKLGASIAARDRQVAVIASCRRSTRESVPANGSMLVEATEHGWWYAAPLIDGRCVCVLVTDAAAVRGGRTRALWRASLTRTQHVRPLLDGFTADSPIRVCAAGSQRIDRVIGKGWLAVGDAASAFDPLSSQGIVKALRHGELAAKAVVGCLDGDFTLAQGFQTAVDEEFATHRRTRAAYYRLEQRFPQSRFWRLRQQDTD